MNKFIANNQILINDIWTNKNVEELIIYLKSIQDKKYTAFNKNIINTTSIVIGVQIPKLRIIAKQIIKGNAISFLNLSLPDYYELHILYALILSSIKDNNISYPYFSNFVQTINNWSVCDLLCSDYIIVKTNKEFYLNKIKELVITQHDFTVRVGIILLMKNYLDSNLKEVFNIIKTINNISYYVEMGIAWLLAESCVNYNIETINYIKNSNLSFFVKNKAYQKMLESFRVSNDNKVIIKQLKYQLKNNK